MDTNDYVMNSQQKKEYVFDRKLFPGKAERNAQISSLKRVIIHNAQKTNEVEKLLERVGVNTEKYFPIKSTEAHFYANETGDLHVVNPRGVTRLMRDEQQVEALSKILGRPVELRVDHYQGDSVMASRRFENFAFEMISDIFRNIDKGAIETAGKIFLLIGPHRSLTFTDEFIITY